jgi:HEAT repeat protein
MVRSAIAAKRADTPALTQLNSPDSVAALSKALADPNPNVRARAAVALAELRDPATIPALARIIATWRGPALARCRRAVLRALLTFGTEEAAVELTRALAAAGPGPVDLQERSALLAVSYAEPSGFVVPRVVRALIALLADEDAPVAERAVSLLMLFPSESHRPLVRALRASSRPDVRRRAAQALSVCRQEAAVTALVAALKDPAPRVRAAAAASLGGVCDSATAIALQAARGDLDERVQEAARSALDNLATLRTAAIPTTQRAPQPGTAW